MENPKKSLAERDAAVIWHPYTQMKLAHQSIPIVRGEGVYLIDEAGNRYIDAIASWWVNIHGHAHPYIAEKVSEQLYTLEHVIFAGFTHPKAIELAERLLTKLPDNQAKIFYSDNGSTATEVAMKMAFQYWHNQNINKTGLIAFENAYHGDTFGAMSASGRGLFTHPFNPFLFEVNFIPLPLKGEEEKSLEILENLLKTEKNAAFIFEVLVLGAGGMYMYEPEILDKMIALCRKYAVISIADEVMTGFGRTGKLFACDYLSQKPDIICLSKGLTGGTMALGLTSCTNQIYEAFLSDDRLKTFFHGHSYTANPLACTAALASLDLCEKSEFTDNLQRISTQHNRFKNKIETSAFFKEVRLMGTILAMEINTGQSSYLHHIRDELYVFFLNRKILLRPLGNILYLMPPYCISNEELAYIYEAIAELMSRE